jgi:hypothetical protein
MVGRRNVSREWTEKDIEELKSLAGKRSTAQIAVDMDRTIGGIIQKAFDLRLSLRVGVPGEDKLRPTTSGSERGPPTEVALQKEAAPVGGCKPGPSFPRTPSVCPVPDSKTKKMLQ